MGLVNPVPVGTVKGMGAEFTVAVNVIPDMSASDKTPWTWIEGKKRFKEPNISEVLMQSIYIGARPLVQSAMKSADLVIEPAVDFIGPGDFHRARECILQGELAAADQVPRLKRMLLGTWQLLQKAEPARARAKRRQNWGFGNAQWNMGSSGPFATKI